MKAMLEYKTYWFARNFFILVSLFIFQYSIVPVSATPIILEKGHHSGNSESHIYDKVESSLRVEGGLTNGLSRVFSVKEVQPDYEVLEEVEIVATRGSSSILLNTSRKLQAKFKHAGDFGVVGNYNKANAAKFSSALNQHINAPGTQIIQGAYRNANNPVTFYLNPNTGLNVVATRSGQFITGSKLSPAQVNDILTKGFLW